jgi:hypothetical protein
MEDVGPFMGPHLGDRAVTYGLGICEALEASYSTLLASTFKLYCPLAAAFHNVMVSIPQNCGILMPNA